MFRLMTRNPPRSRLVKDQKYGTGSVRVYPYSPEDIALQLWCPNGRYALVALSPREARAIGEALIEAADAVQLTPLEASALEKIVTSVSLAGED